MAEHADTETEKFWKRITAENFGQNQCGEEILEILANHYNDMCWNDYKDGMWDCLVYLFTFCNNKNLQTLMWRSIDKWTDNTDFASYDDLTDYKLIEDYILNGIKTMEELKVDIERRRLMRKNNL